MQEIDYHDMLITVNTNTKNLCKKLDKIETKLEKIDGNFLHVKEEVNKKLSWSQLLAITVVLIGIFGSIIGFNYKSDIIRDDKITILKEDVIKNQQKIDFFHTIKKH